MTTASLPFNSTNVRNYIALNSLRAGLATTARLSPELALAWTEKLFFTPPRHDWPQAEREWLARAEQGTLHTAGMPVPEWDGKPMRSYRWGEARRGKIVVQHGWGGRATQFQAFLPGLLDAGYQVIAIDAPGHGASAGKRASLIHFAQALTRLVRNEGAIDGLIAHSLGGAASIYALASEGLPVGRVALIAPSADVAVWARQVSGMLGLSSELQVRLRTRMETRFGLQWDELNAIRRAAELQQPALIVHDRGDKEVAAQAGIGIASAWVGAQLQLTEGLGHRRILKDAAVVDSVLRFMRG